MEKKSKRLCDHLSVLYCQGGTDRMLEVLDAAEGQNVAVAALWIQDWSGKIATAFGTRVFWNWRWNQTWYPLLDVMIKDLDERRGVKAWIN
jgi:alpha-glucosidase